MPCYFWQGTFWWYISCLFPFGSFSKSHTRILLLEVIGSKKAQNLMLLDILNYIIKGAVIFSGWSYIISWQKKDRFRLVFETLLSALKRWYIDECIFLVIGKVTCSKIFELTYIEHFIVPRMLLLNKIQIIVWALNTVP